LKYALFRHCRAAALIFLLLLLWGRPSSGQEAAQPSPLLPGKESAAIVFAPHCDDETIACGGLFNSLAAGGGEPIVVMMTNGDGYTFAAEKDLRRFKLSPAQYVRFAYERQLESIAAMGKLGLPADSIFFLGYPDRGLEKLWSGFWSENRLYRSPYTHAYNAPYSNSYVKNAPYCGSGALRTVENILLEFKPTHVIVPDPRDWHSDHRASFDLVALALSDLKAKNEPFAGRMVVLTYLVHFGNWPKPRGLRMDKPLAPPYFPGDKAAEWLNYPLDFGERQNKYEAILNYESQLKADRSYLFSFIRANELFRPWTWEEAPGIDAGSVVVDGNGAEWNKNTVFMLQLITGLPFSSLGKRTEAVPVGICSDEEALYIMLPRIRKPSSTVINLVLHAVYRDERPPALFLLKLKAPGRVGGSLTLPAGSFRTGKVSELRVPLAALGNPAAVSLSFRNSSFPLPEASSQTIIFFLPRGNGAAE
jgi:LmbE family N-acetylglucosaminyl deacetylase